MKHSIIKFGGSVITAPDTEDHFHKENAERLARELYPHYNGCIVVHGTGHVGKPPAIRHGYYKTGIMGSKDRLLAVEIKESIRMLNIRMIRALTDAGIPAVPLDIYHLLPESPSPESDQAIRSLLERILSSGCVPVLFGDMITTENGDFRVVSSDEITLLLARILLPEKVIFLTDTDGVYGNPGDPPETAGTKVVPVLDHKTARTILQMENPKKDVSGGMHRKVELALETAKYCKTCFIGNGLKKQLLHDFLFGRQVNGTYVLSTH